MKSTNYQKNEILFIGKVKLIINHPTRKDQFAKISRVLTIDLINGGLLYDCAQFSLHSGNRTNIENKKASIEKLENPSSIFQIEPENQIHECNGDSIDIYLNKLSIIKDKAEVLSFYCNNRENYMLPIIFESKSVRTHFHIGVLMFQLYSKYFSLFEKYQEIKNLHTKMNMKLFQSVALSIATKDFVIDPEIFSVVQLEHFQAKIIKQAIQNLSIKTMNISKSSGRLNDDNLFSLRLRFKIVDSISLNYFYDMVPEQIFRRNVHQFDINGCGVSDKMLPLIILKQQNRISSIPIMKTETQQFQNLMRLDLSNNDLTDFCFLTLGQFVAYTPKLSDLCLSKNRIKLQTISSLKKQNVTIPKIASQASLLSPESQNPSANNAQEPFFIQFLLSLHYLPLNYLNLDHNQIQETEILVEYIIEGSNVPLRYLSIQNNKINEVDKIRMAKLIISQVTDRGESQLMPVIDFGYICVIDEQVYRYIVLLKEKTDELHLQNVIDSRKSIEQSIQIRRSTKKISSLSLLDLKKSQRGHSGIINVSITSNKEWQICDQGGILQVSNLYRNRVKTTTRRRSQIMIQNMLMGSSLTPSNSQSSLKVDSKNFQQVILNSETLKPAVKLLRQAYITSNYTAIQYYKEQLIDYNQDLYNKKIAPLFLNYEKIIKKEKMKILSDLEEFINFSSNDRRKNSILLSSKHIQHLIMSNYSEENINDKLNSIISKFFRKRIQYHFNQQIILYEGELDEETMPGKGHCWNVFTFLLFLKLKRDELIERYIAENYNPYQEIHQKLKYEKNLYKNYYKALGDWVCQDNYYQKLLQIVTEDHEKESEQEYQKRKSEQRKNMEEKMKAKKWSEKNMNELIKDKFLEKCKYNVQSQVINRNNKQTLKELSVNRQEQFLCSVEPKLLFTGYLIKYYNNVNETNHISMIPKLICNLGVNNPILSDPISQNIKNLLDYTSKYDLLTSSSLSQCTCINPNLSVDALSSYEDIKLAMYNGNYEESLKKFSSLVIAFLKFFYHSPYAVLPQTLQYLNYLINIILLQKDRYNVQSLSTQFYLQLLTYNVNPDPQMRAAQIHPKILATLIEFCSMYLVHPENLQPYIISHILRMEIVTNNSANKNSMCRMVRHNIHRYNKTEDQLSPQIVSYIFENIGSQEKYFLGMPVDIHYYRRENNNELEENKLEKITLKMHILSTIPEIMSEIAGHGICADFEFPYPKQEINGIHNKRVQDASKLIRCNTNWGLFIYSNQTQKISLLLPNSQQILNLYSLLKKQIITLPTKISKYMLLVKQLISPIEYPLFKSYSYSEYENFAHKKQKWAQTIKQVQGWYIRIYRGFRDYGGCLTMMQVTQKNVYLVDIIVECVLCFMLTKNANRIIQMTTLNVRKQKQFLTALCTANIENLEYFCPKGASYTLSNQQKTHVYEQCLKQLSQILTEVTIQPEQSQIQTYDQFLFKNMAKFHEDCKFITDCTVISDPYGHQEVLLNSYGLVWVDRIIYVEAVLWRFVYNITVVVEKRNEQNQIKSIVIEWLAKERQNERYSQNVKRRNTTKQLRINSTGNKDSSIFMNSCLVMIKNIGLRYISYANSTLYRLISNQNLGQYRGSINILQNEEESGQEKLERQTMRKQETNIYSIWQQIISTIYYKQIRKNVDEQKKENADLTKNNNEGSTNKAAHEKDENENEDQNMNRFFKSKINNNLSAYLQNKRNQLVNVNVEETPLPISEPKERKVSDDISSYQLESHKSELTSNHALSNDSGMEYGGKQQKKAEEIIVTNARKSGKRELPKRRSSRDK